MTQHIHIAVCFFVWFFTKQNFYYYTKEIRQTTRGGIQKQWRSVLLTRVPAVMVVAQNTTVPKVRGDVHQKTILAKLEEEQTSLKTEIKKLLDSVCEVDFEDDARLRDTMAQTMKVGSTCYITGKKSKKLQKAYQDYVKVTDKVNKTRKSLFQIETAERKMALAITAPAPAEDDWGELGAPPSPPKLIRQNAEFPELLGVESSGGATVPSAQPEAIVDEDVPESWEDL